VSDVRDASERYADLALSDLGRPIDGQLADRLRQRITDVVAKAIRTTARSNIHNFGVVDGPGVDEAMRLADEIRAELECQHLDAEVDDAFARAEAGPCQLCCTQTCHHRRSGHLLDDEDPVLPTTGTVPTPTPVWKTEWPAIRHELEKRFDEGHLEYGDGVFDRPPRRTVKELTQEALDIMGWGFILVVRLKRLERDLKTFEYKSLYRGDPRPRKVR
jgi:hypothetical protein